MSNAKICDSCGNVFPEGAEDSATGQVTRMVRGSDGIRRPQSMVQDNCPTCVKRAEKREQFRANLSIVSGTTDVATEETGG